MKHKIYIFKTFMLIILFNAFNLSSEKLHQNKGSQLYSFNHYMVYKAKTFTWDFGDGTTESTNKNPTHLYSIRGRVVVTLTLLDSASTTYVFKDTMCITGIEILAKSGIGGYSNKFEYKAIFRIAGLAYNWSSDYNSLGTDTVANETYKAPGNYGIYLYVTDTSGCNELVTKTNLVKCNFSGIKIKADGISSGDSMTFQVSIPSSLNNIKYRVHYALNLNLLYDTLVKSGIFSGNQFKLTKRLYTTVSSNRTIFVYASLSDSSQCRDSVYMYTTVSPLNSPPDTILKRYPSYHISKGQKLIYFENYAALYSKNFTWNFGDGNTETNIKFPTHKYASTGKYFVTLKMKDSMNISYTFYDTVCVTGVAIRTTAGYLNYQNFYEFKALYPDNNLSYQWYANEYNSTVFSTDTIAHYSYLNAGYYKPSLLITEKVSGCTEELSWPILVKCNFSPIKIESENYVISGDTGIFKVSIPSGIKKTKYYSHFSASPLSTPDTSISSGVVNGNLMISRQFYTKTDRDIYVYVSLKDSLCKDSIYKKITIETNRNQDSCKAYMDTTMNDVAGAKYNVGFSVRTKFPVSSYFWGFGDGKYSTSSSSLHKYSQHGILYKSYVEIHYLNNRCPADSLSKSIALNCETFFKIEKDTSNKYSGIIRNYSLTDSLATYLWSFGDGDTSTAKLPVHTYSGQGPYLLCLKVSNYFCSSSYCDTVGFDVNGNLNQMLNPFSLKVVEGNDELTGLDNALINEVSIECYPNPATDIITVSIKDVSVENITVISIDGRLIKSIVPQEKNTLIDCKEWPAGIYIIKATTANNKITFKKVIKY